MPAQHNPFPGRSIADQWRACKEKNFFETRVTEYQAAAALRWD
jgi:hypothetical protein